MLASIGALIVFSCYAAILLASRWLHFCDDPRPRSSNQSSRSSASISRKRRPALSRRATIR
jgi:hypothetical protein